MGHPIRRLLGFSVLAAGVLTMTTSCAAFRIGNPLLPQARILVTAEPQIVKSDITYSQSEGRFQYQNQSVTFKMGSYPGDITPGVLFTDYTIKFKDQTGTDINSLLIPSRRLGINLYIPRGGGSSSSTSGGSSGGDTGAGATGGSSQIDIPAISESVTRYGIDNGFRNLGTETSPNISQNPDPWNQNIVGEVTFYGRDDNQYPIQAVGTFTVSFQTAIAAAQQQQQ